MARRYGGGTNPLAAILGAVGGGFQGYADANERRTRDARVARQEGVEADRFAAQQEDANFDRSLKLMLLQHEQDSEAAKEFQRDREVKDNEGLVTRAMGGDANARGAAIARGLARVGDFEPPPPRNADPVAAERAANERSGLAYLAANASNAEFTGAVDRMMQGNPRLSRGLAAYAVARAMQRPPAPEDGGAMPGGFGGTPLTTDAEPKKPEQRTYTVNGRTYILPPP